MSTRPAKNRPTPARRKRRTREHVIADTSLNHVERLVLRCGFAAEVTRHDYGIDMILFFYDAAGEVRNGQVMLQVKATDTLRRTRDGTAIAFQIARPDLAYWLEIAQPVILVVYDARAEGVLAVRSSALRPSPRFSLVKGRFAAYGTHTGSQPAHRARHPPVRTIQRRRRSTATRKDPSR